MTTDIVIVLTTIPDRPLDNGASSAPVGDVLARALVEEGLAACVNVLPSMISTYRWKGAIERDVERQVVIKTTRDRVPAIQARLGELHPYELPEFLVVSIAGQQYTCGPWRGRPESFPEAILLQRPRLPAAAA